VVATRVKAYDTIFPLRMCPSSSSGKLEAFDKFIDQVVHPLFITPTSSDTAHSSHDTSLDTHDPTPSPHEASADDESDSESSDEYEVELIKKRRVQHGQVQYLVKWKGYNNRFNVWRSVDELTCDDLISEYESTHGVALNAIAPIEVNNLAITQANMLFGENDKYAIEAVSDLIARQSLSESVEEFLPGYKREIVEMLKRRLRLLGTLEATSIAQSHALGRLKMILEAKRDGRKKGRLILQGFREPKEWDEGSVASPVAYPSSLRTLLFHAGPRSDVISLNDVSVAFLQSNPYPKDQAPRYVEYQPYAHSHKWLFELMGSIYGQRSASREWFKTISSWLISEGFVGDDSDQVCNHVTSAQSHKRGRNEPCLFINPTTQMKVLLYVDDICARGSLVESNKFHDALEKRFDCREGSRQFLSPSNPLDFTGITITMEVGDTLDSYYLDQSSAIASFLVSHNLDKVKTQESPMPNPKQLTSNSELVDEATKTWCKSVNGQLHYFARGTRWDITHATSRLSALNSNPTLGMVDSIHQIAGYLKGTLGFRLGGMRRLSGDDITTFTDSDHIGDKAITFKSRTGVLILLNGIPCHWRSNKQPKTSDSPACAEIYALKEGVKDARLFHWVAHEMGIDAPFPFCVKVDSTQAKSFAEDTCAKSKIRGSFDMREAWIQEVRDDTVVEIEQVDTSINLADLFTKCLPRLKFVDMRDRILHYFK